MKEIKYAAFHEVPFANGLSLKKTLDTAQPFYLGSTLQGLKMYHADAGVVLVVKSREVLVPWANVINVEYSAEGGSNETSFGQTGS